MNLNFEGAFRYLGVIVSVVLIVSVNWWGDFVFEKKDSELLAALLIGVLTQLLVVAKNFNDQRKLSDEAVNSKVLKIVDLLKIHNDFFDNSWLFSTMSQLVDIVNKADKNPYDSNRIKKVIEDCLHQSLRIIHSPTKQIIKAGELGRIVELNDAVRIAKKSIKAVTVDKNNYFDDFWQPLNNEYIKLNIEAARAGVVVERVFVVSSDRIDGDSEKATNFKSIVKELKSGGPNVKIYVIDIEKIDKLDQWNSFLIGDDYFVSESDKDGTSMGYIAYRDHYKVEELNEKFKGLKYISKFV